MIFQIKKSFFKFLSAVMLVSASAEALALTSYVKNLNDDELLLHSYVAIGIIASLLVILLVWFFLSKKSQNKLAQALKQKEQEIKYLPNGILHLSLNGSVQFLNDSAERFLGRPKNKLLGTKLKDHFADSYQDSIDEAMIAKDKQTLLVEARVSNLFLGLTFGGVVTTGSHPYIVVTLANQDIVQRELQSLSMQVSSTVDVLNAVGFARARVYSDDQLWLPEDALCQLLSIPSDNQSSQLNIPTAIDSFEESIHKDDLTIWNSVLDDTAKHGAASAYLRVERGSDGLSKGSKYVALEIHMVADKSSNDTANIDEAAVAESADGLANNTDDAQNRDYQATLSSNFTMLVRENSIHEWHIANTERLKRQQHCLSEASGQAAYVLDENGSVLWANAEFNELLNRLRPGERSLNFMELSPFPDEVMQLHIDPPYNPDTCESITFEMSSDSVRPSYFRLELSVYVERGRLNNETKKGVAAVLHDITDLVLIDKDYKHEKRRVLELNDDLMNEQTSLVEVGKELSSVKETLTQQSVEFEQTKQSLSETNEKLESVGSALKLAKENSPVAIAVIDEKDRIISSNRVMQERLKYSDKELKQGNIYKLFSDPTDAGVAAKLKNTQGELHDFHVLLKGNDGALYPGEITIKQIDPNTEQSMVWIVDRSDEQFQRDKFENVIQNGSMPIAVLEDGGFCKANAKACRLFGLEEEEDLLKLAPYSAQFHADEESSSNLARIIDDVKQNRKTQTVLWHYLINGAERAFESTFVPIYKDNSFDSILCMWQDKSEVQSINESLEKALVASNEAQNTVTEQQEMIQAHERSIADLNEVVQNTESKLETLEHTLQQAYEQKDAIQEQYQVREQELQDVQQELTQSHDRIQQLDSHNAELNEKLDAASKEIRGLTELRVALNDGLNESRTKLQQAEQTLALNQQSFEQVSSEKPQLTAQIQQLEHELSQAQQESDAKNAEILSLTSKLEELQQACEQANENTQALNSKLEAHHEKQHGLDVQNAELTEELDRLVEQLQHKNTELDQLKVQMQGLESQHSDVDDELTEKLAVLETELAKKDEELSKYQVELQEARSNMAEHEQDGESLSKQLVGLEAELGSLEESAKQWHLEKSALQQEIEELTSGNNKHAQEQVSLLQDQLASAESNVESLQQQMVEQKQFEQEIKQELETQQNLLNEREQDIEALNSKARELEDALQERVSSEHLTSDTVDIESDMEKEQVSNNEVEIEDDALLELDDDILSELEDGGADLETVDKQSKFAEIMSGPMPQSPDIWFNFSAYFSNSESGELQQSELQTLLDSFYKYIVDIETSIENEDFRQLKNSARALSSLAIQTKSEPLMHLISGIKDDSEKGMIDNVSIRWPSAKQGLHRTMRVILSHLDI